MRHEWIDPEEEISYTVTPDGSVLSGGLEAELRPHYQAVAAPLAREILRLASALAEERERTLRLVDEAIAARQGYAGERDVGAHIALVKLRQQLTTKEG